MSLKLFKPKKDSTPRNADHILSVSGVHVYSMHDGERHQVLDAKGKLTGQSFGFGDKGWCIVKRLKMPEPVTTFTQSNFKKKTINRSLKSLV